MYQWRKLAQDQREFLLRMRQLNLRPWHHIQHEDRGNKSYHLSTACFEHRPIIGASPQRMALFEKSILELVDQYSEQIHAWCILPNHYHLLFKCSDIKGLIHFIGKIHGRTSHEWNGEDDSRGRKVWCDCLERAMRSERHFWATMNYVHHNPVHHHYVTHWQDWPFSSGKDFLERTGKLEAEKIWMEYPILDYGKDWDPPDT